MLDVREHAANKEFLRSIVDNDYKVPDDIDTFAFAKALLANFSSVDGEMRDELSYMILARGIIDNQRLTTEQLRELLVIALDKDHLFYRIGEVEKDSVFMRSFSTLIIAAILYTDDNAPVFSQEVVRQAKDDLLHYAKQEKDWRGYVNGKGWAHTMAHLAEALDVCAQSVSMTQSDREDIMRQVGELARLTVPLYHEEDMRLATVAYRIIACKQVSDEFLSSWLESCFVRRGADVDSWMRVTNVKNFLRSLYFRLFWDNLGLAFVDQIAGILRREDELYLETFNEI